MIEFNENQECELPALTTSLSTTYQELPDSRNTPTLESGECQRYSYLTTSDLTVSGTINLELFVETSCVNGFD
jgi:hypothetical protein